MNCPVNEKLSQNQILTIFFIKLDFKNQERLFGEYKKMLKF